jgi:hypothetical protein
MAKKGKKKAEQEVPRALGWEAIDAALAPIYGTGEPPFHYAAVPPAALGGNDPLQGISVYQRKAPGPHWHFVTYGFSELHEKESKNPEYSGFGFELTFRLSPPERQPPGWALNFLQNIARYVFKTGNVFDVGHYLNCNGPIALGQETDIRAVLFAPDPELGEISTPNGKVHFLQVVGITLDELLAVKKLNAGAFLKHLGGQVPLLVTDLGRRSILLSEKVRRELQEQAEREGSSTGYLAVGEAHFELRSGGARVILGANGVRDVKELLPLRLQFGNDLVVVSSRGGIHFTPGKAPAWKKKGKDTLEVTLTPEQARRLAEVLQPRAGEYSLPDVSGFVVEVRKSEIKDQDGNVTQVIG